MNMQILYIGCPAHGRAEAGRLLAAAFDVLWTDTTAGALSKLHRRDMRFCSIAARRRGARTARPAHPARTHADVRRRRHEAAELTKEAVVSGVADVFARPLARRAWSTLERKARARRRGWPQAGARTILQPVTLDA
jgi:hypothetical protein